MILAAEGDQQSPVLRAEGDRQSRALRARGEAEALQNVFDTVREHEILPSDMLGYKYLDALPAVAAGDANKLLLLPVGGVRRHGRRCRAGRGVRRGAAPDDAERKPPSGSAAGLPGRAAPPETPALPEPAPLTPVAPTARAACRIRAPTAGVVSLVQEERDPDAKSPGRDC